MNKTTQLFIRACKSNSSEFRLKRLYCKYYYHRFSWEALGSILLSICEKYDLVKVSSLIRDLNPHKSWIIGDCIDETGYWERVSKVLACSIRLSSVGQLPGLSTPAWIKNRYKEN